MKRREKACARMRKMAAGTSARPKMVASNFCREKTASLFFRSIPLHTAKEKQNFSGTGQEITVISQYIIASNGDVGMLCRGLKTFHY